MIQRGRGKMVLSEIIAFDAVLQHFQDIFIENVYSKKKLMKYHKRSENTLPKIRNKIVKKTITSKRGTSKKNIK